MMACWCHKESQKFEQWSCPEHGLIVTRAKHEDQIKEVTVSFTEEEASALAAWGVGSMVIQLQKVSHLIGTEHTVDLLLSAGGKLNAALEEANG